MRFTACLIVFALLQACTANEKPAPSNSMAALREIVAVDIPADSVHWEVFGTPEYLGGVPGPTDYVTLIAELVPAHGAMPAAGMEGGMVYIVPEAARPWLSDSFRHWLAGRRNGQVNLPEVSCSAYRTTVTKSARPVAGLACRDDGRLLLYLTLSAEQ